MIGNTGLARNNGKQWALIKSIDNSNIADMSDKYDIAQCDGTSDVQTVTLPPSATTKKEMRFVSVKDATENTVVKSAEGTTISTLAAAGDYRFFNDAGTWIKL